MIKLDDLARLFDAAIRNTPYQLGSRKFPHIATDGELTIFIAFKRSMLKQIPWLEMYVRHILGESNLSLYSWSALSIAERWVWGLKTLRLWTDHDNRYIYLLGFQDEIVPADDSESVTRLILSALCSHAALDIQQMKYDVIQLALFHHGIDILDIVIDEDPHNFEIVINADKTKVHYRPFVDEVRIDSYKQLMSIDDAMSIIYEVRIHRNWIMNAVVSIVNAVEKAFDFCKT